MHRTSTLQQSKICTGNQTPRLRHAHPQGSSRAAHRPESAQQQHHRTGSGDQHSPQTPRTLTLILTVHLSYEYFVSCFGAKHIIGNGVEICTHGTTLT